MTHGQPVRRVAYPGTHHDKRIEDDTMTIPNRTITADDAVALMREAVNEKGADYVYPSDQDCMYFTPDGAPACIVGQVFAKVGITLDDIVDLNEGYDAESAAVELNKANPGFVITSEAQEALSAAQATQDARISWGNALYNAAELAGRDNR